MITKLNTWWNEFDETTRKRAFGFVLVMTAVVGAALVLPGNGLRTAAAPMGMISLELNFGNLGEMLGSYNDRGHRMFLFQVGLDYLFMTLYPTGIILGMLGSLRKRANVLPRWFGLMSVVLLCVGICDAIENAFLYIALLDGASPTTAWGSTIFASTKFVLLVIALGTWLRVTTRSRLPVASSHL